MSKKGIEAMNTLKKMALTLTCGLLVAATPVTTQCGQPGWLRVGKYLVGAGVYALLFYGSPKDVSEDLTGGLLSTPQVLAIRKLLGFEVTPKKKIMPQLAIPTDRQLSEEEIANYTNNAVVNTKAIFKKLEESQEFKAEKAYDPTGYINRPLKTIFGVEFGAKTLDISEKVFVSLLTLSLYNDLAWWFSQSSTEKSK